MSAPKTSMKTPCGVFNLAHSFDRLALADWLEEQDRLPEALLCRGPFVPLHVPNGRVAPEHRQGRDLSVRYMIRQDMPSVLGIERASFQGPWCQEDFVVFLRQGRIVGMVVELAAAHWNDPVAGFVIYELQKEALRVINFAVHPDWRRLGLGTVVIDRLRQKLIRGRRQRITFDCRLDVGMGRDFLRASGFRRRGPLVYWDLPAEAHMEGVE